jgi:hypothetical protein
MILYWNKFTSELYPTIIVRTDKTISLCSLPMPFLLPLIHFRTISVHPDIMDNKDKHFADIEQASNSADTDSPGTYTESVILYVKIKIIVRYIIIDTSESFRWLNNSGDLFVWWLPWHRAYLYYSCRFYGQNTRYVPCKSRFVKNNEHYL